MIHKIEAHRSELQELCRQFRVGRLALFGSAATGAFRAGESDLDFLVEFDAAGEPGYAGRYFGLKESLEALFRRPVGLVVDSAITNPFFRESVKQTRLPLYAA